MQYSRSSYCTRYSRWLIATVIFLTNLCFANTIDDEILALSKNPIAVETGKRLYDTACTACHGKQLEGGAGFNLKDEAWVHGDTPSQILSNIQQGFSNAGMPAFGAIFDEAQLINVVAYISYRREGLQNLNYKIFHIDSLEGIVAKRFQLFSDAKPYKTGKSYNNLADFSLPEVSNYIMEYSGTLHTPKDRETVLYAMIKYSQRMEIEIDGVSVEPSRKFWLEYKWPLKRGSQQITLRFFHIDMPSHDLNAPKLFVAMPNSNEKLFGLSPAAKQFMKRTEVMVKAIVNPTVVRKKILDLPSSSIAVGYPNKTNYAFNAKSCGIVAAWTGELLNIGPNIEGRGKDASLIPGEFMFKAPQQLVPSNIDSCKLLKYSRQGNPSFHFTLNGSEYSLTANSPNSKQLTFSYAKLSGPDQALSWQLPAGELISISAEHATVENTQLHVPKGTQQWQITVAFKG